MIFIFFPKDPASSSTSSIYTGICEENGYFEALGRARHSKWQTIFSNLDTKLHSKLSVVLARNLREKDNASELENKLEPDDEVAFVGELCVGLSMKHTSLLDELGLNQSSDVNVEQAIAECRDVVMTKNQEFLDRYLDAITSFICKVRRLYVNKLF